jgi:hemolysin D
VREGQPAAVKLEAFPFTRYGTVSGRLRSISRDAVADRKLGSVYVAVVTLDRASIDVDGKHVPLSAGLSVTADVRTGTRRIISYLLSPMQTSIAQAGHEQ